MTNIWEQFDKDIDLEGFKQDVKEQDNKSGDFEPLPLGDYEVALSSLVLKTTKETNKPMITSTFEVIAGNHTGRLIFVNQVVESPMQVSIGLRFINSMMPDSAGIEFEGYAQLAQDLEGAETTIKNNYEYVINLDKNKKDYDVYKIKEIFELE